MKRLTSLLAGIVILLLVLMGCGGPAPSTSPAPTPTSSQTPASPTPTKTPPSPSPSLTQTSHTQGEEGFPPYPGATQVSKVQTTGTGPSGQEGTVTVYFLTTNDPYEKVKGYYQGIVPADWKTISSAETTGEDGKKTFVVYAQSPSEDIWVDFIIAMSEENVVSINHSVGNSGGAPTTGAPETGKVKPYPGAEVLDTSEWSGVGPNGQEANWTVIRLSTTDSYEKVKAYYQVNTPPEFSKVFDHEETDEDGARTYVMMLQSPSQAQFYAIYIAENLDEKTVEISHNYGTK
jgi:hypothetical protein